MRIALGIEYDGTSFCGWQRQQHSPSVQQVVEEALSRVADEQVTVHCAGRTDTGVHASGQVIHFETDVSRTERAWVLGANRCLPNSVSMLWTRDVADDFHARFSARSRTYHYRILNRWVRPALQSQRVAWEPGNLNVSAMARAARQLEGEHDFSAFRAAGCQSKQPVRLVRELRLTQCGDLITLHITANGFLHHMVRNIAGTLIEVGRGNQPASWVANLLAGKDRSRSGPTAPACGLYFQRVEYPAGYGLPVPG